MRAAILSGSTVTRVVMLGNLAEYPGAVDGTGADVGDTYAAGVFTKPGPVVSVPASVSPRQIRQALTAAGLRTSVEAAVAASDQDTQDWYEFSTAFERAHPAVVAMGVALGVSSAALDALWTSAAAL